MRVLCCTPPSILDIALAWSGPISRLGDPPIVPKHHGGLRSCLASGPPWNPPLGPRSGTLRGEGTPEPHAEDCRRSGVPMSVTGSLGCNGVPGAAGGDLCKVVHGRVRGRCSLGHRERGLAGRGNLWAWDLLRVLNKRRPVRPRGKERRLAKHMHSPGPTSNLLWQLPSGSWENRWRVAGKVWRGRDRSSHRTCTVYWGSAPEWAFLVPL